MTTPFILGVDLGKVSDPTAAVMLHPRHDFLAIVALDRWEPGRTYGEQAGGVVSMVEYYRTRAEHAAVDVLFDITNGIGSEAVTEVASALEGKARVWYVLIHGGQAARLDGSTWHVPKTDLVSAVGVAMEKRDGARQLQLMKANREWEPGRRARHAQMGDELAKEMRAFAGVSRSSGSRSYGNDPKLAAHDDLVLAAAIGVWWSQRSHAVVGDRPSPTQGRSWLA